MSVKSPPEAPTLLETSDTTGLVLLDCKHSHDPSKCPDCHAIALRAIILNEIANNGWTIAGPITKIREIFQIEVVVPGSDDIQYAELGIRTSFNNIFNDYDEFVRSSTDPDADPNLGLNPDIDPYVEGFDSFNDPGNFHDKG